MTTNNVSLDDVLDALMLEEREPSHAALVRWCKLYPKYRDDLTRYFATWSMQRLEAEAAGPVALDEKLAARTVDYVMDLAKREGRIEADATAERLSDFDQLVLTAIYLLHGDGYSVNITDKVSEMSGESVLLGSTFGSLTRLQKRGLIRARMADPQTEPEHQGRRYFTATLSGERALAEARETSKIVADFLGDFA